MRILVTGGVSFIEANFVHRTLQQRPDVRITVLDAPTYAAKNWIELVAAGPRCRRFIPTAHRIRLAAG